MNLAKLFLGTCGWNELLQSFWSEAFIVCCCNKGFEASGQMCQNNLTLFFNFALCHAGLAENSSNDIPKMFLNSSWFKYF